MPKSLVELITENWEIEEGNALEPSELEAQAIRAFDQSIVELSDEDRAIIADVIAPHIGQDTITADPKSISILMTFSNILNARFNDEPEIIEGIDLTQLDQHLENTDLSTKFLVAEMFAKEMQGANNLGQLVHDLTKGLSALDTPETKQKFLVAQDKLLSKNLGKVAMDTEGELEIEVRRSTGSFLADQVFIPNLHKSVRRELSDAQSEGANVAAERQSTGVAEARQLPEMMTSFHEFINDDIQREYLGKEVIKAIQGLEEVAPEAGKYSMSDDEHDSVDVKEVDGGKYDVVPGKNFTGIIQINRQVPEGEEESFDVLEFKNGVLVSGVEGARGESQISNMEALLGIMVSESQEPPFFVFNSPKNRSRVSEKVSEIESVVAEIVATSWEPEKYSRKKLADALREVVSDNIQAVQKKGVWGYSVPLVHSGQYHKEKQEVVDRIAISLMDEFAKKGISESVLEKHREKILNTVYDVVIKKNVNIQELLSEPESLGNPEHVRARFDNLGIGKMLAEDVWRSCKEDLAREVLCEAMVKQMKESIQPEKSSYKTYTEYRDKLVEHIVDKAIEKLPKKLIAEQIIKNHDMFLEEFKKASKTQDVPIREFLKAHRDTWFGQGEDVAVIKGFKEVTVAEKVAQDTMKFKSKEIKEEAIDDVINDIRGILKNSQQGGFPAATWLTREWHDQQKDAVVEQMLEDIKKQLMRDSKITTEMLYNNRDDVVEVVKDQVQANKDAVKEFLDKKENQTHDFDAIKARWSSECGEVTESFVRKMSEKFTENMQVESERERVLLELKQEMERHVKEMVAPVEKRGVAKVLARISVVDEGEDNPLEYYVERDVMAAEIADQMCKELQNKRLSYGALRRDREAIIKSFAQAVEDNADGIKSRLEQIVAIGATGKKAAAAIRERQGEEKDVNVAEHIADGFSRSVAAVMEVQKVVPRLDLGRSSSVPMPPVPQTARLPGHDKKKKTHSGAQTER